MYLTVCLCECLSLSLDLTQTRAYTHTHTLSLSLSLFLSRFFHLAAGQSKNPPSAGEVAASAEMPAVLTDALSHTRSAARDGFAAARSHKNESDTPGQRASRKRFKQRWRGFTALSTKVVSASKPSKCSEGQLSTSSSSKSGSICTQTAETDTRKQRSTCPQFKQRESERGREADRECV